MTREQYPNVGQIDWRTTQSLWDFHEMLAELLVQLCEEFYEDATYFYSQRFDQAIGNVRYMIRSCEEMENFKSINPNHPNWYQLHELYQGSTNIAVKQTYELGIGKKGWQDKIRSALIPTDYMYPAISAQGDLMLWKTRWKSRLENYQKRVIQAREKLEPAMDKELSKEQSERFFTLLGYYNGAWQHLRDLNELLDPYNTTLQDFEEGFILCHRIRYNPKSGTVYVGRLPVTTPTQFTQEWAVWKLLSEKHENPRRAKYSLLEAMEKPDGEKIFTQKIDGKITTLINRWNRPFKPHKVAPLHYEPFAIVLRLDGISKPK